MTDFSDTDPRVARMYLKLLREITPAGRLSTASRASASVRTLVLAGIEARTEGTSKTRVACDLSILLHGVRLPLDAVAGREVLTEADLMSVAATVAKALDHLGVRYLIGGSLASALHGVPRASIDADILADLRPEHAEPLAESLADDFYLDRQAILAAINHHSSFNLIHLASMYKVNIFVARGDPFEESQFSRRVSLIPHGSSQEIYFAAPEDIVLAKLSWYKHGNYVYQRQWNDVIGVLRVQGDRLDADYMRSWASELGLSSLLEQAMAEADESLE